MFEFRRIRGSTKGKPLLYVITWLTDFAVMLVVFCVSRGLAESGAGLLKMGVIGAVFSFLHAGSSVLFGRLSDRYGRPRFIAAGAVLLTLFAAGCFGLAPDRPIYIVLYCSIGLALGMMYPAMVAWISAAREGSRQISGGIIRFCVAWNLGMISGQLTGGFLFPIGRTVPLLVAVCLGTAVVGLVIIASRVPSYRKASAAAPVSGSAVSGSTASEPAASVSEPGAVQPGAMLFARLNWIANIGSAFSLSMILHLFPKLAFSLGVPSAQHGTILAVMRGVIIIVYFLLHFTRFWQGRFAFPLIAQAVAVAGLVFLFTARALPGLLTGLIGLAVLVGYNYFAGLYYSNAGSLSGNRGRTSGLHEGTLGGGIALGSLCGGVIGSVAGIQSPYLLGSIVILCLMAVQIAVYRRFRHSPGGM